MGFRLLVPGEGGMPGTRTAPLHSQVCRSLHQCAPCSLSAAAAWAGRAVLRRAPAARLRWPFAKLAKLEKAVPFAGGKHAAAARQG